jgi:ribosomal protein S18 acetylase RimI-like enzyme
MSIIYKNNIEEKDYKDAYKLQNDNYFKSYDDFKYALDNTRYIVSAYIDNKLVGFARALSEGVETAFIIGTYSLEYDIRLNLIKELEKLLIGKRKMLFANPNDIKLYEELGYLRCKNAYTYINFDINKFNNYFLPLNYKFETEFYRIKNNKKIEILNKEITYKDNFNNVSFNEINDLLTKAFFNHPHDINKTTLAFNNSNYYSCAFDNNKLVGIARAVSDGTFATILNVAVDPNYQGLNIGRNILLNLSKKLDKQIVFLNTHAGSAGFYNKIKEYRRNKTAFEKGPFGNDDYLKNVNEMFLPIGFRFIDEY